MAIVRIRRKGISDSQRILKRLTTSVELLLPFLFQDNADDFELERVEDQDGITVYLLTEKNEKRKE